MFVSGVNKNKTRRRADLLLSFSCFLCLLSYQTPCATYKREYFLKCVCVFVCGFLFYFLYYAQTNGLQLYQRQQQQHNLFTLIAFIVVYVCVCVDTSIGIPRICTYI